MPSHVVMRTVCTSGLLVLLAGTISLAQEPTGAADRPAFKRRSPRYEKELNAELQKLAEFEPLLQRINLTDEQMEKLAAADSEARIRASFEAAAAGKPPQTKAEPLPSQMNLIQIEHAGLRLERSATLPAGEARIMASLARFLRTRSMVTMPDRNGNLVPPPTVESKQFQGLLGQRQPELVACLVQMLQVEAQNSRLALVKVLEQNLEEAASVALARLALYDLSPDVRQAAVEALAKRSADRYRHILLDGLRYPWPPIADHAAEALVGVSDREAVPELQSLLDLPDPSAPVVAPGTGRNPTVPELVRINHLKNCVLCHAQAKMSGTLLRPVEITLVGLVPRPGRPLSPVYYTPRSGSDDILVRADITFLRQDFSVMQPVENAKPWPEQQRFDFMIRMRQATAEEMAKLGKPASKDYPQRESVLWALKELEGK